MNRFISFLFLVLLTACAPTGEHVNDVHSSNTPKNWRVFSTPGNTFTYLAPTTMEDGTRCVVAMQNSNAVALSCEFFK